jgi:ABC-type Mn2+/Zn2+ transport system ATPase subunit
MAEKAKMLFSECSGGQRQRILIGRALARDPEILILDEPTTGIDPGAQREVLALLTSLRTELGLTMLIVTQHFGHLESLFEEVAWVNAGMVEVGAARDLLTSEHLAQAFGRT